MREFIVLMLFASIGVAWSASCAKPYFGGCDKSRGLCWEAVNTAPNPPKTTFCTCKAGYVFRNPASRKGKCVDINECKTGAHSCDTVHGRCVNTIGSHYCVCNRGYVLDFTKTHCLLKSKITGTCSRRIGRYYGDEEPDEQPDEQADEFKQFTPDSEDEDELKNDLVKFFLERNNADGEKAVCTCEKGYRKCGNLCKDINECKTKKNKCDKKHGYCHNSIGGYYCSCKNGFLLGPCGFKCYKPGKRPATCSSASHMASTLVRGDSNGLNDEASKSLVLDVETERAYRYGQANKVLPTLEGKTCTGGGSKTQKFDVNHDGKIDVIIHFICRGGKYVAKSTFEKEAKWGPWTCWTECKATCHGGIQTRARYCKNGLVGEGKCAGPATQYKTCYKGKRCPLRVRRNANKLTKAQKCDLLQAFKKYKADTSTNGFWAAAGTHVFPSQCINHATGGQGACCYHGAKLNFVTWHRAELLNFEEGLTRYMKDKTLGLPYWDWLVDTSKAPSLVWNKKIGTLPNPFAKAICRYDLTPHATTQRSENVAVSTILNSRRIYLTLARKLMESHTIHEFSEELENAHNGVHGSICTVRGPQCIYSMGNLAYAAFDPIFFFHHTNVDRLFSNFQRHLKLKGEVAWTRQSALEPQESIYHFNEPYLPYRNKTLTAFKKLNHLSSMQDLYYYKHLLGYTYDTLNVPKSKVGDFEKHTAQANDAVNIMQYEKSIGTNVKMTYFVAGVLPRTSALKPCNQLAQTDPRYVGQATILGTKGERKWSSKQPTLVSMTAWIAKNWGQKASTDYTIRTCYTHSLTCTKNCPQVSTAVRNKIPSSQLMYYPKNIREDIQKFEWAKGIRMPTWGINMKAATEWIYFWGKEKANVYQVSKHSYNRCSTAGGHRVTCTGACILPTGYHYFVVKNRGECLKGLKLKVLSSL